MADSEGTVAYPMTGWLRIVAVAAAMTMVAPGTDVPGWTAVVDGYKAALKRAGIVGSSLLIVRDGKIVARQNEGLSAFAEATADKLHGGVPVDDDTIFHWA